MPEKQFVLATYADTEFAQKVVQRLIDGGFDRQEIRIWYRQQGDDAPQALLRTRVPSEQVEHAVDVFNSHPPGLVEIRAEWSDDDWSDLVESPDAFAVVDLY